MSALGALGSLTKASGLATNVAIIGGVEAAKIDKVAKFFGLGGVNPAGPPKKPKDDTGIAPISEFIANLREQGLAQKNNYTFTFFPPTLVLNAAQDLSGFNNRMLNLMCASTELPSVNIATQQIRYFGEIIDMPNDKNYGSLTSTFYVDASMNVKLFFDRWIDYIQDPNSREFRYYKDYTTDVILQVFDRAGLPHYMVILHSAFPKSIGAITLSQDSRDIMQVTIEWSYRNALSYTIPNSVKNGTKLNTTARAQTLSEKLLGYAGKFKDYQNRFNNLSGDISRVKSLTKNGDFGGLVGQNLGGGWF